MVDQLDRSGQIGINSSDLEIEYRFDFFPEDDPPKCYCGSPMILERADVERGGFGSVLLRAKDFPYYRCPDHGDAQMDIRAVLDFDLKYLGLMEIYEPKSEVKWFRKEFIRKHLKDLEYYKSQGESPLCRHGIPFTEDCYWSGDEG